MSEDGAVLVFVGSRSLDLDPGELALPLLGALFGAEMRAWAAAGQVAASTEAARHANALTAALDRSRGELERAIQAKQQLLKDHEMLLGIVGHDLRNPLNTVVMGTSMLLDRGDLPAGHIKTLQRIKTSSHRMVRMIADLLDFERSREGTIPITRREIALRDVVAQVVEELEVSHPTRTLELVARADGRGSWDADRLAQVVSNLVGNALQHSPPDAPVTISLAESAESVVIEVSNAHRGAISEDDLRRIFEPFRRGKESTGLGLGLYIVQQIAKAHGGFRECAIGVRAYDVLRRPPAVSDGGGDAISDTRRRREVALQRVTGRGPYSPQSRSSSPRAVRSGGNAVECCARLCLGRMASNRPRPR